MHSGELAGASPAQASRRTFLLAALGAVATPLARVPGVRGDTAPVRKTTRRSNWAGNITFHAKEVHRPPTVRALQTVAKASDGLKAVGTRHSFSPIADTSKDHVSLEHLRDISFDRKRRTVTVGAGLKYGDVCPYLHRRGFALHNLASLPHISIAGAIATATHGSGDRNGNLATAVSAIELVTAGGEVVTLSGERDGDKFKCAVVGLGAVGIVTKVTLDLLPAFDVRQYVYEHLPLAQVEKHLDEILAAAYSVSLFTAWEDDGVSQVWLKQRLTDGAAARLPETFFGATPAPRDRHPVVKLSAKPCTPQMGVPGPWYDRLPHFRMDAPPSSAGDELHSEYYVPRKHGAAAYLAIHGLREKVRPVLQISEVRSVDGDDLAMSPCFRQPSVTFHFTWKKDWPRVRAVLPDIEKALAPFNARPHWGKLFTMDPKRLRRLYPKLGDFQRLVRDLDPKGKLRNEFLARHILGADEGS